MTSCATVNGVEVKLSVEEAKELFDFISEHLDVVNNTPAVEDLMIRIEDHLDL